MTSYSDILFAATTANRLLRTDWHFIWQATGWTDIMQGGMTPQAAAEKAFKRVEEIFAKYPIEQS